MKIPILSIINAIVEILIFSVIFYCILTHLSGKKLRTNLFGWTILIQIFAIIHMLSRLKTAQDLIRTKTSLELLILGHVLLSILVFFWLVLLFFKARHFSLRGQNYLQENKKSVYLFLIALSLSFLSGELIFFLVY